MDRFQLYYLTKGIFLSSYKIELSKHFHVLYIKEKTKWFYSEVHKILILKY